MSANMNRVILAGHLTRDVDLSYTPTQTPVASFGLAINRKYKDTEETTFVDCTAFGKQAETISAYLSKGKPILLEGRLQFSSWADKQTGQKRSKLKVIVDNFQFLGQGEQSPAPAPAPARQITEPDLPGYDASDPDSVPF